MCAEPGPPHGWSAEAREILHWYLAEEGMSPGQIFSASDRLWVNTPRARASFVERMLVMMLGGSNVPVRCIEEEIKDGCVPYRPLA